MMTLIGTGLGAGIFALATVFIVGRIAAAGGAPRLASANAAAIESAPHSVKTGRPAATAPEAGAIEPGWTVFMRGL